MLEPIQYIISNGVHLALEANDSNVIAGVPHTDCISLEYGRTVLHPLPKE